MVSAAQTEWLEESSVPSRFLFNFCFLDRSCSLPWCSAVVVAGVSSSVDSDPWASQQRFLVHRDVQYVVCVGMQGCQQSHSREEARRCWKVDSLHRSISRITWKKIVKTSSINRIRTLLRRAREKADPTGTILWLGIELPCILLDLPGPRNHITKFFCPLETHRVLCWLLIQDSGCWCWSCRPCWQCNSGHDLRTLFAFTLSPDTTDATEITETACIEIIESQCMLDGCVLFPLSPLSSH